MIFKKSVQRTDPIPPGRIYRASLNGDGVGLDIGTTHIVVARNGKAGLDTQLAPNAFLTVLHSSKAVSILAEKRIPFLRAKNRLVILGQDALLMADALGIRARKPVDKGLINAGEKWGVRILDQMLGGLMGRPRQPGERVCFSVPGTPLGESAPMVFHEEVIRQCLEKRGYRAESVNEGLAVVLAELAASRFTGIGISLGGGMCHVCYAYLAVPVITYSIQKGGDAIDAMVGKAVGKPAGTVKRIKESSLDLSIEPRARTETALQIYYDHLFAVVARSLWQVLGHAVDLPGRHLPLPLVLSGGTILPKGCRERFAAALEKVRLPVTVSDIRVAANPLYGTVRGALCLARTDEADF